MNSRISAFVLAPTIAHGQSLLWSGPKTGMQGVTDLREMVRNTRRYLGGDLVAEKQFGDETDDLKDRSPLYNIEKIKTPILLMHGDEDRSVPVAQSQDFAEELEGSDKNVRYIELKDGGHNLAIQENRTIFFEELDAFLKEHLGVIEP